MTICDMAGFEDSSTVLMGMMNHPVLPSSVGDSWDRMARLPAGIVRRLAPDWETLTKLVSIKDFPILRIVGKHVVSEGNHLKAKYLLSTIVSERANRVLEVLRARLYVRGSHGSQGARCTRGIIEGKELYMMALHFAIVTMQPLECREAPSESKEDAEAPSESKEDAEAPSESKEDAEAPHLKQPPQRQPLRFKAQIPSHTGSKFTTVIYEVSHTIGVTSKTVFDAGTVELKTGEHGVKWTAVEDATDQSVAVGGKPAAGPATQPQTRHGLQTRSK